MSKQSDGCLAIQFVAHNELGVHETAGPEATERIMEYEKHTNRGYTGSDEEAWCSKFANFVVDTAGEEYGFKGTDSAAARSWLNWGVKIEEPIAGCIVVIDRKDENNPTAAHVTFFEKDNGNGTIDCLGGNQHDMVKVSIFNKSKVLAYIAPNLEG